MFHVPSCATLASTMNLPRSTAILKHSNGLLFIIGLGRPNSPPLRVALIAEKPTEKITDEEIGGWHIRKC